MTWSGVNQSWLFFNNSISQSISFLLNYSSLSAMTNIILNFYAIFNAVERPWDKFIPVITCYSNIELFLHQSLDWRKVLYPEYIVVVENVLYITLTLETRINLRPPHLCDNVMHILILPLHSSNKDFMMKQVWDNVLPKLIFCRLLSKTIAKIPSTCFSWRFCSIQMENQGLQRQHITRTSSI